MRKQYELLTHVLLRCSSASATRRSNAVLQAVEGTSVPQLALGCYPLVLLVVCVSLLSDCTLTNIMHASSMHERSEWTARVSSTKSFLAALRSCLLLLPLFSPACCVSCCALLDPNMLHRSLTLMLCIYMMARQLGACALIGRFFCQKTYSR